MVAPTAAMVPLHPDGEIGHAPRGHRGVEHADDRQPQHEHRRSTAWPPARRAAVVAVLSVSRASRRAEEILDSAQAAGCTAVVVTVDQQASYYERTAQDRNLGGTRRRPWTRRRAAPRRSRGAPGRRCIACQPGRLWYTWQYLDEVRQMLKVPLLVKGILTAEDAALCLEHGVDGIIVSNHGGRSMDYGPSTLEVLPEIVAAVNGRVPVITDSGYRRGSDILKALALGAERRAARPRDPLGARRVRRAGRAAAARDDAAGARRRGGRRRPPDTRVHRQDRHQNALRLILTPHHENRPCDGSDRKWKPARHLARAVRHGSRRWPS